MPNVSNDQAALLDRLLTNYDPPPPSAPWPALGSCLWLSLAARVASLPSYASHSDVSFDYSQGEQGGSDAPPPEAVTAVSHLDSVLATHFSDPSAAQGVRHSVLRVLRGGPSDEAAAELAELLGLDQLDLASALVQHSQEVVRLLDPNATAPKVRVLSFAFSSHSHSFFLFERG